MENKDFDNFFDKVGDLKKWTENLKKNRLCLPKELVASLQARGIEIDLEIVFTGLREDFTLEEILLKIEDDDEQKMILKGEILSILIS